MHPILFEIRGFPVYTYGVLLAAAYLLGLQFALAHRRAEVGYWIAKPEWGNGYASEATRCVLAFGFDVMQLHRIEAHHFMENPASGRVLERVGMCANLDAWTSS